MPHDIWRAQERALRARIRFCLAVFAGGLLLSGATALPLEWETRLVVQIAGPGTLMGALSPGMASWLALVAEGVGCGFGVIGSVPLVICHRLIRRLEAANQA